MTADLKLFLVVFFVASAFLVFSPVQKSINGSTKCVEITDLTKIEISQVLSGSFSSSKLSGRRNKVKKTGCPEWEKTVMLISNKKIDPDEYQDKTDDTENDGNSKDSNTEDDNTEDEPFHDGGVVYVHNLKPGVKYDTSNTKNRNNENNEKPNDNVNPIKRELILTDMSTETPSNDESNISEKPQVGNSSVGNSPGAGSGVKSDKVGVGEMVSIEVNDTGVVEGEVRVYTLNSSTEISVDKVNWYFDDGSSGSGVLTPHSYDDPGVYNVSVTVTGRDGNMHFDEKSIEVERYDPFPKLREKYGSMEDRYARIEVPKRKPEVGEKVKLRILPFGRRKVVYGVQWTFHNLSRSSWGSTAVKEFDEVGAQLVTATGETKHGEEFNDTVALDVQPKSTDG